MNVTTHDGEKIGTRGEDAGRAVLEGNGRLVPPRLTSDQVWQALATDSPGAR